MWGRDGLITHHPPTGASRTWPLPRSVKQFLVSDFFCDFQVPAHVGVEECRMGGAAALDGAVSHVCAVRKHGRSDVVTYHAGSAGTLDGRGCVRRTLPWGGRMPKGVGHAMVGISVRAALDDVHLWCCARVVRGVRCAWRVPSPSGYAG